ncbi:MAG: hypothetical protein K8J08_18950 [Thermoanaerobaculia bacterium]|nr:hypothetical protein [Thermoanaerobaculia bacterium]
MDTKNMRSEGTPEDIVGLRRSISGDARWTRCFGHAASTLLLVGMFLFWLRDGSEVVWPLAFAALTWLVAQRSLWGLVTVFRDETSLYLRRGKRETSVPLLDILDIHTGSLRQRTVALRYRDTRGYYRWSWFVAPQDTDVTRETLDPHPIVAELREAAGLHP